jgi:hypothetical protein
VAEAEAKPHFIMRGHAWLQRLLNSRYFLYALGVHLAVLAILGGRVIMKAVLPPEAFDTVDDRLLVAPASPPVPPQPKKNTTAEATTDKATAAASAAVATADPNKSTKLSTIAVNKATGNPMTAAPGASVRLPQMAERADTGLGEELRVAEVKRIGRVYEFQKGWGVTGSGRSTKATFTCYLAKYLDGDWNCNPTALENMLTQIVRWSSDKIQASVQPQAISVGSDEIFKIKPPFIFMTGHKDFHFTEEEVKNVREYLLVGGAIWADNSLPGRHSRFDEAFRREMKRVLPDREWEAVPKDHPIFNTYFRLRNVPKGMNNYQEQLEQMKISDELAVIYTLNAYSDLWETALNEDNKIDHDLYLNEDTGAVYNKYGPHYGSYLTGFLYRNVNDESIVEANQLAINITVHLLTRYQDKFLMIGKSTAPGAR